MNNNKKEKVEMLFDLTDDLPDGAFFAFAEELGISLTDILEHSPLETLDLDEDGDDFGEGILDE